MYKQLVKEAQRERGSDQAPAGGSTSAAELPVGARARLAALGGQWPVAESLLLAQGRVSEAIDAYKDAHRCMGGGFLC